MQATTTLPKITATADGEGVVSHAGSRLLADVADKTTLTGQLGEELGGLRKRRARHDPGRVVVDMAVAVADGATTIFDVAVLADQAAVFGAVASDSTCWRLLAQLDTPRLGAVARARAAAREVVWAQRAELTGEPFPPARAAGRDLPGVVIDLDASLVVCHSEKEQAAPTRRRSRRRLAITRCWRSATTPASSSPPSCGRATRVAIPPLTTSPSWTPRWPSSRTPTGTAPRSWSARMVRAARRSSSSTSGVFATRRR